MLKRLLYSQRDSNPYFPRERGMAWPLADGSICIIHYFKEHIKDTNNISYLQIFLAESIGFEPMVQISSYNGLANRPFRPLRQLSKYN